MTVTLHSAMSLCFSFPSSLNYRRTISLNLHIFILCVPYLHRAQGAVAAAFRQHVHCQFFFRGAEREDITLDIIRARVRQIIGKGTERKPLLFTVVSGCLPQYLYRCVMNVHTASPLPPLPFLALMYITPADIVLIRWTPRCQEKEKVNREGKLGGFQGSVASRALRAEQAEVHRSEDADQLSARQHRGQGRQD